MSMPSIVTKGFSTVNGNSLITLGFLYGEQAQPDPEPEPDPVVITVDSLAYINPAIEQVRGGRAVVFYPRAYALAGRVKTEGVDELNSRLSGRYGTRKDRYYQRV